MAEIELPPGIGPHEGRELELMLAGPKALAMFCDEIAHSDYFPEQDFAPHLEAGVIVRREELYANAGSGVTTRCVYYALPGEEWRVEAAHAIQLLIFSGGRRSTEADDIELGRLLGYTQTEIDTFLGHMRRCGQKLRPAAWKPTAI